MYTVDITIYFGIDVLDIIYVLDHTSPRYHFNDTALLLKPCK